MSISMKDFVEEKRAFSRAEIIDAFHNAIPEEMMKDITKEIPELALMLGLISAKAVSDLFREDEQND